jgi:transposase InsO family protein
MEMVVYDHKTLDFASRVKRADGWHRVRLVLTCILDKRSRMILGWWIDEIPSTVTIIRATRMMVEAYGCPESGQFDNGRDFKSYWFSGNAWNEQRDRLGKKEREAVSCVIDDLGMAAHFTEPYHGQSKHIERAFGFFAIEFDKSFESYLGSNTSDRHEESRLYTGAFDGAPARPIEELPTIEETRALFAKFAQWYNTKHKHRGQGMNGNPPKQVFQETLRGRRDVPEGWEKYVWTRREIKTVQRNGVRDGEIWYYNEKMQEITGQRVELRVSIDDIGKAYLFNLEGEYLYDAVSEFKDSGITEENVRNVRRLQKEARKHLDEYQKVIKEIGKDKKSRLEELRAGGEQEETEDTREVAGGEPLAVIKRRRLRLPTDPD